MTDIVFIDNNPNLIRDVSNNGVLNTNTNSYNKYLHAKKQKEQEKCKIDTIENDLKLLKDDLFIIKQLLLNFKNESC